MYTYKRNELNVSDMACYLNKEYIGNDLTIVSPEKFKCDKDKVFYYFEGKEKEKIDQIEKQVLIITYEDNYVKKDNISYIFSDNPKKDFYIIVNEFFVQGISHKIDDSVKIDKNTNIGINVNIGRNSVIEDNVKIGNNTYIGNNVTIASNTVIGPNCVIKNGAMIGSEQFAFIDDADDIVNIPQFGGIEIEESVWIGANTSIEKPFLDKTHIEKNVKIDDLVHIGQATSIGEGSKIAAGCIISASVVIGENCFLGMNSSIREHVSIGNNSIVGMGSVVISNIGNDVTCVGVPAKTIKK